MHARPIWLFVSMRCQRWLKWYLFFILILILGYYFISTYEYAESIPALGRLDHDATDPRDTYMQRLKQFLSENNRSLVTFENQTSPDVTLLAEVDKRISRLQIEQREALAKIQHAKERRHGCQSSCCWFERSMPSFYSGESDRLPTVLDRLSQIDMKLLADVHFGNLRVPHDVVLPKLTNEILPCLQNRTIIFVDTPSLRQFWQKFHPKIAVDYILLTGDSDQPSPPPSDSFRRSLIEQVLAGKTHVIHWFGMNCRLGSHRPTSIFSCLPQGLSQWFNQRYYLQLVSGKDDSVKNHQLKTNDYWLFASFSRDNGPEIRRPLWNLACHGRLKSITRCVYGKNSNNQWRYYLHIARSKFVLSPPGGGMDCYRTWEALYLGSIPIVLRSSIDQIYDQLPVLIIDRYEDLTISFLEQAYENMTRGTYDYRRLYKGYWQRQISLYRNPHGTSKEQNQDNFIQYQYVISRSN